MVRQKQNFMVKTSPADGTTLSFVIALVNRINISEKKPQAMVVTPSFESSMYITKLFKELGKYRGVKVVLASNGNHGNYPNSKSNIKKNPIFTI